jgi:hypothetical protein
VKGALYVAPPCSTGLGRVHRQTVVMGAESRDEVALRVELALALGVLLIAAAQLARSALRRGCRRAR